MNQVSRTIGWREAENLATRATWATIRTCLFSEAPGEWIIENVATLPAYRRRGLGNALLAEILAKGRRKGCRRAQISVLIGNTPAQQAYEKVGFQVVDERRHPDFEALVGASGIRRLAARIDYEQGEHPCSRSATIIPLAKLFR
jgi:ribosomal protein S18 acetylase RimI-like enzyme